MKKFNFKEAVAEAKCDYPQETKDITFIDTSSWFARWRLKRWLKQTSPQYQAALLKGINCKTVDEAARLIIKIGFTSTHDPLTNTGLVTIDTAHGKPMPLNNMHFALDHELGHQVVKNATPVIQLDKNESFFALVARKNGYECKADDFATLRGIKRGSLTREDARQLSANRALSAYFGGDAEHLTTLALDNLLLSSNDANIAKLSPQDVKAIAERHGEEFKLTENTILKLTFSLCSQPYTRIDAPTEKIVEELMSLCTQKNDDPTPATLAARIVSHIFDSGKIEFPIRRDFDISAQKYRPMREKLKVAGFSRP